MHTLPETLLDGLGLIAFSQRNLLHRAILKTEDEEEDKEGGTNLSILVEVLDKKNQ